MQQIVDAIIEYAEENNMTIRDVAHQAETKAIIKMCLTRTHDLLEGKIFMISTPSSPSPRDMFMSYYDDIENGYVIPIHKDEIMCEDNDESMTGVIVSEIKMICSDKEEQIMCENKKDQVYTTDNVIPRNISKRSQSLGKKPFNNPVAGRSY